MVMPSVGRRRAALKADLRAARATRHAGMVRVEMSGGVGRVFRNCGRLDDDGLIGVEQHKKD
jgi:hypothetical protein